MVKGAIALGMALTLAGVAAAWWPREAVLQGRALVDTRTYERRGPRVFVDRRAAIVRDGARVRVSITSVLSADGYLVRSGPEFITRDRLEGLKVLVVNRPLDALGDWRTITLVRRWIDAGGAALVLSTDAPGPPERRHQGAGRVATLNPEAFDTRGFAVALLDAMHWLDDPPA